MTDAKKFESQIVQFVKALGDAKTVLITAPGAADGDSIGTQLALRRMILHKFPSCDVRIINDELIPERYRFLPDVENVDTPESYEASGKPVEQFDVAVIVDGGIDRAGRLRPIFEKSKTTVFIDHHVVSVEFPYTIRMVEQTASSTTELLYHISQTDHFKTPPTTEFCQQIYLGLIFDTGFFRHSNTTPEALELGAQLLRSGFDFTRVGERGMLERSFSSLQLLSYTLSRSQLRANGKIIWSSLSQETLQAFNAKDDDREGIIDHLFLTRGIEVAVLFFELTDGSTKVSFRSQGDIDVARFAKELTQHGGGHQKAAGANLNKPVDDVIEEVLTKLELKITQLVKSASAS